MTKNDENIVTSGRTCKDLHQPSQDANWKIYLILKHNKTFSSNFLTLRDLGCFSKFSYKRYDTWRYEVEVDYKFKFIKRASM